MKFRTFLESDTAPKPRPIALAQLPILLAEIVVEPLLGIIRLLCVVDRAEETHEIVVNGLRLHSITLIVRQVNMLIDESLDHVLITD